MRSAPCCCVSSRAGFEVARARGHDAHVGRERLEDDRGDLAGEAAEGLLERAPRRCTGTTVVRPATSSGHSRAARDPEGGHTRSRRDQERVAVAVVPAVRLHEPLAARGAPRQADGAHRRLGARVDEAHHLDRGHQLRHPFGQPHLGLRRRAEGRAVSNRSRERSVHEGRLVPEEVRPVRHHVVEVGPAVRVAHARPLARCHEEGLSADGRKGPHGRRHAARHQLPRSTEESGGSLRRSAWGLTH